MTTPTFDDGKDDGALRTIGEVGKALGIKPHVLRYWEQQFPMLQPLKRSGGRRYYRPEDVELLEVINDLVNEQGYTLKGAMKSITEQKRATSAQETPASIASDVSTGSEAAEESPPVVTPGFDIDLPSQMPSDGGVDAFFARSQGAGPADPGESDRANATQAPSFAQSQQIESADDPGLGGADDQPHARSSDGDRDSANLALILPELHQLRDRLAAAIKS